MSQTTGLSRGHPRPWADHELFGIRSPRIEAVRLIVERVADTDATVLVRGESGVGKELVARAIHYRSARRDQPFIKVNCAALPRQLLESELFGYERGAFTGAAHRKLGKFEDAHGGTIFLDEIGDLPLDLQAKLLHVLQDQEFSRVGGHEAIRSDARVIAATNQALETAMSTSQFRQDLYYRLDVVSILVPPLRERREDIPLLANFFLERLNAKYKRRAAISPETMRLLVNHAWPGNLRELENTISRLVLFANEHVVQQELLGATRSMSGQPARPEVDAPPETTMGLSLVEIGHRAARQAERLTIKHVLETVRWNRAEAARHLKISYKALLYKIDQYGLA